MRHCVPASFRGSVLARQEYDTNIFSVDAKGTGAYTTVEDISR